MPQKRRLLLELASANCSRRKHLQNKEQEDYTNDNNNKAYIIDPNTGQKIYFDDIPSDNFDKVETYYIEPKTGKEIKIDEVINHPKDNHGDKTYKVNNNYNNTYKYDKPQQKLKNSNKDFHNIISKEEENKIYTESITPVLEQLDLNATILPTQNEINEIINNMMKEYENKNININPSASTLSVSTLSNLEYHNYPVAKKSFESFANISGFGLNSYNGKKKNFNEDRIHVYPNKVIKKDRNYNISYFSIFDGHSGNKCSEFLKKNFSGYLFNSHFFPKEPLKAINESFQKAENEFFKMVYDPKNNKLHDKSGSCALVMLIVDNILYSINLGDSRALYSYDTGKFLFQITRDHKPNDEVEKKRIEKCGGSIYYANKIHRNGKEIELKEEDFGKGFTFPYRIKPGGLAVSYQKILLLIILF